MTNAQIPSYSGVTINISNPTVNASAPYQTACPPQIQPQVQVQQSQEQIQTQPQMQTELSQPQETLPQAYPPSYYLNNYNYQQNGVDKPDAPNTPAVDSQEKEEDMSSSTDIINDLDAQDAKQKELEENGKQTRIVALTDEYIMSLENYLNNQNTDIRLMAAKEILTRLDEDKSRFDDAALNALLNKMLQDPQKIIRTAALSAFSSGLASGNDYTVQLLNNIQQNPNSDKQDVVEAANILLKMSADSEIKYTPQQTEEQKAE